MRRLLRGSTSVAALAVAAGLALVGCSYVTPPALAVSAGKSSEPFYTLSRADLMKAVDATRAPSAAAGGAMATTTTTRTEYSTTEIDQVLNLKLQLEIVKYFAKQAGAAVTEADRQQAKQEAQQSGAKTKQDPDLAEARVYITALTRTLAKQKVDSGQVDIAALIKKFYDDNLDKFKLPEQTCFHLIGIPAGDPAATTAPTEADYAAALVQANAAKQRVGPETFEAVADSASKIQGVGKGGDVGCIDNAKIPPDIIAGIAALPIGAISEPLRTTGGYYVIRLDDRQAAKQASIDEAKPQIEPNVIQQIGRAELQAYLARELDRLDVVVDPRFGTYSKVGDNQYRIVAPPGSSEPTVPTTKAPSALSIPNGAPDPSGTGAPSAP